MDTGDKIMLFLLGVAVGILIHLMVTLLVRIDMVDTVNGKEYYKRKENIYSELVGTYAKDVGVLGQKVMMLEVKSRP